MVTCDQQEKVLSSQKVILRICLQIRNLILRYAELNRLLVGSGLIPLKIELQEDDRTVCCGHNTMFVMLYHVIYFLKSFLTDTAIYCT